MPSSHSSTVSASSLRSIMPFSVAATALRVFSSTGAGADISVCLGWRGVCVCVYVRVYVCVGESGREMSVCMCVCVYIYSYIHECSRNSIVGTIEQKKQGQKIFRNKPQKKN